MTLGIIVLYLAAVVTVGILSHRRFTGTGVDYFVATRTIGPVLLLASLFGTHMTAFSLLGASGEAYHRGIGVFALMASSSAIVVPIVFIVVGTRAWSFGRRHGYLTQAQFFEDRWGSRSVGLLLFPVLVGLLIPYLLIGVKGAGLTLAEITGGGVPPWAGSLALCAVVLVYVTWGGLRGTAWANAFQTAMFMGLGALTFYVIASRSGGIGEALAQAAATDPALLVRGERIQPLKLLTYTTIPLSVGMFPHIFMHWLTARELRSFRLPILAYPLCVAVVWLPSVLLGVMGAAQIPGLEGPAANSVLIRMIELHAPEALAGLLAAGVLAAVMSSLDSQVLSLSTMFTQDVVRAESRHLDDRRQILYARGFVLTILAVSFWLSLVVERSIFRLGIWSFSGFAALLPLALGALYWRRSTAAGARATILTALGLWIFFVIRGWNDPGYTVGGTGIMPAAVMLVATSAAMVVVSLLSKPPEPHRVARFFGSSQ